MSHLACATCGAELSEGIRFCPMCGRATTASIPADRRLFGVPPSSRLLRAFLRACARSARAAREWMVYVAHATGVWSRASRELWRLRRRLRRLDTDRDAALYALGKAAYRGDEAEMGRLKAYVGEVEAEL